MKKTNKLYVGAAGLTLMLLSVSMVIGCAKTEDNQSGIIVDDELADDSDTSNNEASGADTNVSNLLPSEYVDSDFDSSGKVIFKTEYAVIDKEMESISYIIENRTSEELEYGEEYILEIKSGEQWYQVPFPENYGWNAVAHILTADNMSGGMINLSWMDFEFVNGDYRIVKKFGNYLVRAEFSMGESKITPDTPFGYEKLEDLSLSYTLDEAIEDNVVVLGYQKSFNLDRLKNFVNNAKLGLPAMVRIGFSTIEGDPIFYDLVHNVTSDGREWYTLYHDSRRDAFSAEEDKVITKNNFSYVVTDGMNIYFSDFAGFVESDLFFESSRGIYAGEYLNQPDLIEEIVERWEDVNSDELHEEVELYQEIIDVIQEMTKNRLEWNWTRYKSFSPEGTYYVSLNEEQIKGESATVTFGFGAKGYGTSDYAIPKEKLTGRIAITGVRKVIWLDDETAQLVCSTEKEGVLCYIEFYPGEAVDKNNKAAFGEWEYVDNSNMQ